MKKLLLLLIIPFLSFGQEFHKQYFGTPNSTDYGFYFEETYDGGYIIAGGTTATGGGFNSYIIKTNTSGDVIWSQIFEKSGVGENDWATCVKELENGNFIVAGVIKSTNESMSGRLPYLMELSSDGDEIWTEFYYSILPDPYLIDGADAIRFIEPTDDGGYFLAASSGGNGLTCENTVLKVDENGLRIFESSVCSEPDDCSSFPSNPFPNLNPSIVFNSVEPTDDGGLIFCGMADFTEINNKGYQAIVVKLNSDGEVDWHKDFGGWNVDVAYDLQQSSDGGYIVVGVTESLGIADVGSPLLYLFKISASGDELWTQLYGTGDSPTTIPAGQHGFLIEKSADNNYFILANGFDNISALNPSTGAIATLIKVNNNGDTLWTNRFRGHWPASPYYYDYNPLEILPDNYDLFPSNWNWGWGTVIDFKSTSDGGFIVGGSSSVLASGGTYYTFSYYSNSSGVNTENCDVQSILQPQIGGGNICLTKYDANGESIGLIQHGGFTKSKNLLHKIDLLGRETINNIGFQLEIYDDGSVEKKYLIK